MKFCWTTLSVKNMEESLKFYTEIVKLPMGNRFAAGPGMEIAFLGDGDTKVELIYSEKNQDIAFGKDICIGFEVDSLDTMLTFVKQQGISIVGGPFQPNPHTKFFYVLDPNGMKVQFVENIA